MMVVLKGLPLNSRNFSVQTLSTIGRGEGGGGVNLEVRCGVNMDTLTSGITVAHRIKYFGRKMRSFPEYLEPLTNAMIGCLPGTWCTDSLDVRGSHIWRDLVSKSPLDW